MKIKVQAVTVEIETDDADSVANVINQTVRALIPRPMSTGIAASEPEPLIYDADEELVDDDDEPELVDDDDEELVDDDDEELVDDDDEELVDDDDEELVGDDDETELIDDDDEELVGDDDETELIDDDDDSQFEYSETATARPSGPPIAKTFEQERVSGNDETRKVTSRQNYGVLILNALREGGPMHGPDVIEKVGCSPPSFYAWAKRFQAENTIRQNDDRTYELI